MTLYSFLPVRQLSKVVMESRANCLGSNLALPPISCIILFLPHGVVWMIQGIDLWKILNVQASYDYCHTTNG